ncbi:MAG: F0F1 ATP synthase subunit B [Actinomycetes bacterium]|jgi:F-type H+-transporting ATPase subunit b|nr:MAG: F0F1 ATP synthase subunit B [Streptomycetaceae bacterium]
MLSRIGFLAAAEAGPSPVIPKPAEIAVGFVAFGILFLIIRARAVPRFEKAYKDRTEAIQGGLERAEVAQREAAAALTMYKSQLADARGEAAKLREEARAEGAVILEQMRTTAQEEATRITASARTSIEAERQAAFNSLLNEVGALATELASRIVGESLDDAARQSRVVERFLADVEKAK